MNWRMSVRKETSDKAVELPADQVFYDSSEEQLKYSFQLQFPHSNRDYQVWTWNKKGCTPNWCSMRSQSKILKVFCKNMTQMSQSAGEKMMISVWNIDTELGQGRKGIRLALMGLYLCVWRFSRTSSRKWFFSIVIFQTKMHQHPYLYMLKYITLKRRQCLFYFGRYS